MNISTWLNTSKILLGLASLICSFTLTANTVMVTNTNNSGAGSLRTAMQSTVQNGDTIRFDPALIAGGDATITLLTPIFTTKDITIIGLYNNTATLYISGGATSQIFSINHLNTSAPQRSLTLDSLVFINATAQRGTHLMFTGNNLTIKNSILRDGVSILEGGSIHFTSIALTSTLDIDNSEFYDNESESGGAIFTNGVRNVTVNNSKFHHNEALTHYCFACKQLKCSYCLTDSEHKGNGHQTMESRQFATLFKDTKFVKSSFESKRSPSLREPSLRISVYGWSVKIQLLD